MANDHKQEVDKLVKFLLNKKDEAKASSFVVKHDELKSYVEPGPDGQYDERRVAGVLRAPLRSAGISASAVPGGYRIAVRTERKASSVKEFPQTTPIQMKDNAEDAVIGTMTAFANRYIAPKIFKDVQTLVAHGHIVLIVGPPGCGKSRLFEQLAALASIRSLRRPMSQIFDAEQLLGGLQVIKDEEADISVTRFKPGPLTDCVRDGMFFIGDEYDNAPAEINEVLKMITEKGAPLVIDTHEGVEVIPKHPNFRIGFTSNTWCRGDSTGDFVNAKPQNSASMDRITTIIEMGYEVEVEKAVMKDLGMENHVIELFYGKPGSSDPAHAGLIPSLRTAIEKDEVRGELGMRKIIAFCEVYPILGWHKAMLYTMLNKFDKADHGFFNQTVSSKLGANMVPTSDPDKIAKADNDLKKYRLKGAP